jgi:Rad3-related DNA helicase
MRHWVYDFASEHAGNSIFARRTPGTDRGARPVHLQLQGLQWRQLRKANDLFKNHNSKCQDYIPARDGFWIARQSVTNVHFLYYAPRIEGAVYPRKLLVIDEAHNLEEILIGLGRRRITPKHVREIRARLFDFPAADRELLNRSKVAEWLRYFESAITHALRDFSDGKEKRDYESLRQAINFTLNCGDWITWKEKDNLIITPMSGTRAAKSLFRCAESVLFMSATMGDIQLFLKNLGVNEQDAGIYRAACQFKVENRKIIYRNLGSMSKRSGQPGLPGMLKECSRILRERPDERGIVHCHSRELQQIVARHLQEEFGARVLTHQSGSDRDAGVVRLRNSRNGVLCAVKMTEGLDLPDDEARFCIFAKIPWPDSKDPYIAERQKRSQTWYENVTALSVVQGSGRVVRNNTDHAETFIFDSSFRMLMPRFPQWWMDALHIFGR